MTATSASAPGRLRIAARKQLAQFAFTCDLDLPLSGLTALFGPSGAGKSTLLNLVSGLHRPDTGRISVGDEVFFDAADGVDRPVHQRALGVVFQDARLFPHLSVRHNLMYGFKRAGARAQTPRIGFSAVVDLLGIASLLGRRPHTLSGGEKQRVAIGRALLAQPQLLLMDEPFASLDAARKADVLPYIERLRDEFAVPIVYVSHSIDEVLRLATALVLVQQGQVVAAGPLADVLQQPAARAMLGEGPLGTLVFGSVSAHDDHYGLTTLQCDGFSLRVPRLLVPVGAAVRARLPAREVALALSRPVDVSITNRLPGTVVAIEPRVGPADGPYCAVQVRIGPTTALAVTITRESAERLALAPGLAVWCLIKSVALDAGSLAVAQGGAAAPLPATPVSAANDAQMRPPA